MTKAPLRGTEPFKSFAEWQRDLADAPPLGEGPSAAAAAAAAAAAGGGAPNGEAAGAAMKPEKKKPTNEEGYTAYQKAYLEQLKRALVAEAWQDEWFADR